MPRKPLPLSCTRMLKTLSSQVSQLNHQVDDLKRLTERISRSRAQQLCQEILYAETFNSTISNSSWLNQESFSPGRWAVGYAFLYALYRSLDTFQPKNILELGLGQTTKMISRYASSHKNVRHTVVEHDKSWISFFQTQYELSPSSKIIHLPLRKRAVYKEDREVIAYSGFQKAFKDKKFDFISIDGPFGYMAKIYSRVDVLKIIPGSLADSFVIFLDDSNRPGEMHTIAEFKRIFEAKKIRYSSGEYRGEKNTYIFTSEDLKFLCSM